MYKRQLYDDSSWEFAQEVVSPQGKMKSQATFPFIKVDKILPPKELTSPTPGTYIYDFGQNFSGWARLKVSGPGSTQVKLRFSELLNEDGSLNTNPNQGAGATDIYILKGQGEENYEPRFTYHGFRYVEVRGFPGIPSLETLEGCFVHSEVKSTGSLFTSCSLVNKIHENIRWGQLSNLMSIPTDCPQRDERMGWMGDAQLVSEETIYNFQMIGFFKKWFTDIKKSQKEDGSVPDLVPPYCDFYPADPAWGTACVSIPWDLYLYYGDREILEENYSMMRRWVEFLHSQSKDGILELGKYGDWCPPWHIISVETPRSLVSTWFYVRDTLLFSQIAKTLGKIEDQDRLLTRAEEIKLLSKSLQTLPEKFHGLKDMDLRYRQRYVDLIVNPEVKSVFITRAKIIKAIREYMSNLGYLEVETPVLHNQATNANARPFCTHQNTLDIDMYLRIELELNLKKLIVGGLDKIFEIGKVFRNEGMDTRHNPEFTLMEFYEAYGDLYTMMDRAEQIYCYVADNVLGTRKIDYQGQIINVDGPWSCLLYTSPSPRDRTRTRMPSSA